MPTPNLNLYPPDGYRYEDPKAGVISGGNWPDVIRKLRDFRIRHGIAVGAPQTEIFNQFCSKYPEQCKPSISPENTKQGFVVDTRKVDFPRLVMNWLAAAYTKVNKGKLGWVSQEEAYRRAAICANCPSQAVWTTLCTGCNKNIHLLVDDLMRQRKENAVSRGLQGCTTHGEDVRLSVHLQQADSNNPKKPPHCWR